MSFLVKGAKTLVGGASDMVGGVTHVLHKEITCDIELAPEGLQVYTNKHLKFKLLIERGTKEPMRTREMSIPPSQMKGDY